MITQIKVEGNVSVTSEKVRGKLFSRVGGRLDARTINADIASLNGSKWFSSVEAFHERDPKDATGKSYVLIFVVKEMPVLTSVEFRGLKNIKLKEIQELTGLKVGNRADATRTHLAVGQIKRLYEEKGYELAEVKLLEGGGLGDTRVVIGIFEGEKFYIGSIDFEGNVFATDSVLRTKIGSKTRLLGFIGGKYHRDNLEDDTRKLKDYYTSQGFFEVAVTPITAHRLDPRRRPPDVRHQRGQAIQGPQHLLRGEPEDPRRQAQDGDGDALGDADHRDRQGRRPQDPDGQVPRPGLHRHPDPPRHPLHRRPRRRRHRLPDRGGVARTCSAT